MKTLTTEVQKQFNSMCKSRMLFRSSISGDDLWTIYLQSFKDDPIFRDPNSSEHNCNTCKNFFRRYSNIVSINNDFEIESLFSNIDTSKIAKEYIPAIEALHKVLIKAPIKSIFVETFDELNSLPYEKVSKNQTSFKLGIKANFKQYTKEEVLKFGVVNEQQVYTFNHLALDIPTAFIDKSGKSSESILGDYNARFSVFNRLFSEVPKDTLLLVNDLINQNSLLNGKSYLPLIRILLDLYGEYEKISPDKRTNWIWYQTTLVQESIAKFRNTLLGTLCVELSAGLDINEACKNWNKRIDPVNYMKAVAPITTAQIKEAKKFVEENGYTESFTRRLATIDDIKASEILHINRDNAKSTPINIFDNIQTPSGHGRFKRSEFNKVTEVTIDEFMKDILPNSTSIEVLFESKFQKNLVNLTTSNENSKPIFKWKNPFSFTFNGNLASKSEITENVSKVGGNIQGVLRASLQWNDEDTRAIVDLDLNCIETFGNRNHTIYYGNKASKYTTGFLDVDMIRPKGVGIENIVYKKSIPDGTYDIEVVNYSQNAPNQGFKCEIVFGDETYTYNYFQHLVSRIKIATINVKNQIISIQHHLQPIEGVQNYWGLEANMFQKVNLVCLSPNYWDEEIGHKHYLFMLQNCKNPDKVRSFHNEHLTSSLLNHRKVLDILGNTTLVEPIDNQLAGVGFNATVREEIIVKVKGTHNRIIKIKI